MAYRPRATGDQNGRAVLDVGELDRLIGGIGGNAETSGGLHAHIGRQRHRLLRREPDRIPRRCRTDAATGRSITQTRSPPRAGETPSPTPSISPAPSLCGITRGKAILRVKPARLLTSEGLTPGRAQSHPHLAASRLRRLHLGDPQHLAGRCRSSRNRQRASGPRRRLLTRLPTCALTCPACSNLALLRISSERRGVGAGHPGLRAELLQLAIERGPARRVEMRDHLIQQQHRRKARHFRQQPGMRQTRGRSAAPSARRSRHRRRQCPCRHGAPRDR